MIFKTEIEVTPDEYLEMAQNFTIFLKYLFKEYQKIKKELEEDSIPES